MLMIIRPCIWIGMLFCIQGLMAQSESAMPRQYTLAPELILSTESGDEHWSWVLNNRVQLIGPRDFNNIHTKTFFYQEKKGQGGEAIQIFQVKEATRLRILRYTITNQIQDQEPEQHVRYYHIGGKTMMVYVEEMPAHGRSRADTGLHGFQKIPFQIKRNALSKALKRITIFNQKIIRYQAVSSRRNYRNMKNKAWSLVGRHLRDIFRVRVYKSESF